MDQPQIHLSCLGTLPDNSWVLDLLKRWDQPPLSYYTPVSGAVTQILSFLSQSTTALQRLPTKPYKSKGGGVSPATTLVLDDLISLKHDLVQYIDLCSGTGPAMQSVGGVLNNMFKSQLVAPFSGEKIIALTSIGATPEGAMRCALDFPAMVSDLGEHFFFQDHNHCFSEDELKRAFPPSAHEPVPIPGSATKASLIAERNKDVAQRKEYIANRGKELSFSSVWTPTGWFTDTHVDGNGMSQIMVHFEGEKLWLVWPPTKKNLNWWGLNHPCPPGGVGRQQLAISALKNLEGLELLHVTEPCAFILPPFAIHSVISFSTSTHTGAYFVHEAHWPLACVGLDFAKTLVRNVDFGDEKASALIEEVVEQEQFWLEVMGKKSEAAVYLTRWKQDTKAIRDFTARKGVSSTL